MHSEDNSSGAGLKRAEGGGNGQEGCSEGWDVRVKEDLSGGTAYLGMKQWVPGPSYILVDISLGWNPGLNCKSPLVLGCFHRKHVKLLTKCLAHGKKVGKWAFLDTGVTLDPYSPGVV
jgi:hypothetical protein